MRNVFKSLLQKLRKSANLKASLARAWRKLLHLHNSPHEIALGFALGAFIGVFPTFGLGGIMAIGLCALLKLNYVSAILGSIIIMNPVSTPLFWLLSAGIGSLVFPYDAQLVFEAAKNREIFHSLGTISLIYLTGNVLVSTAVAVVSYYVVRYFVARRSGRNAHHGQNTANNLL